MKGEGFHLPLSASKWKTRRAVGMCRCNARTECYDVECCRGRLRAILGIPGDMAAHAARRTCEQRTSEEVCHEIVMHATAQQNRMTAFYTVPW